MRRTVEDGHSSFIVGVVLSALHGSQNQYIRTNTTATLTQCSHCIAQLISLLGQVAKDEHALVAQDLVEVRNPLRQPGK